MVLEVPGYFVPQLPDVLTDPGHHQHQRVGLVGLVGLLVGAITDPDDRPDHDDHQDAKRPNDLADLG